MVSCALIPQRQRGWSQTPLSVGSNPTQGTYEMRTFRIVSAACHNMTMYGNDVRRNAVALMECGFSLRSISMSTGINRATLREWREHPERGVERAMRSIRPGNKVGIRQMVGCAEVSSCSRLWPCLFPQHGPGRKHLRTIGLDAWQHTIVRANPGHFARGLFHSDGYRGINRVRARLAQGDRWYEYPRYLFSNESKDILRLCGDTLDQLGVAWRYSRPNAISVARREAVARLDEFVGPKY